MSSSLLSSTIIPLLLSLPPLYLIYTLIFPPIPAPFSSIKPPPSSHHDGYTWLPLKAQESLLLKDYTPKTLEPFNGTEGRKIFLALKGTVFDVSQGAQFYGPGESFLLLSLLERAGETRPDQDLDMTYRWTVRKLRWTRC